MQRALESKRGIALCLLLLSALPSLALATATPPGPGFGREWARGARAGGCCIVAIEPVGEDGILCRAERREEMWA